ncbi:MAG: RNA-binding S4 domain-containing protein [Pseudomonadota bacterium]
MTSPGQRLDKWLWFSRLVKTRSLASRLISAGKVRINKIKTVKPAHLIRSDDVLTTTFNKSVQVYKVLQLGQRRGPATEAQQLYDDITPKETDSNETKKPNETAKRPLPLAISTPSPTREQGMGRPTKRDRRKLIKFQQKR